METLNLKSLVSTLKNDLENLLSDATVKRSVENADTRKTVLKPFKKIEKALIAELNGEHTTTAVQNEARRISESCGITAKAIKAVELNESK